MTTTHRHHARTPSAPPPRTHLLPPPPHRPTRCSTAATVSCCRERPRAATTRSTPWTSCPASAARSPRGWRMCVGMLACWLSFALCYWCTSHLPQYRTHPPTLPHAHSLPLQAEGAINYPSLFAQIRACSVKAGTTSVQEAVAASAVSTAIQVRTGGD